MNHAWHERVFQSLAPIAAVVSVGQVAGCSHSQLHGLSDAEAREVVATKIPPGTPHNDGLVSLKQLGPDDVTELWDAWPPPARSTMTAQFDTWRFLFGAGGREVTIKFGSLGTVEEISVTTYRVPMAP
jgi:hypothetical protein